LQLFRVDHIFVGLKMRACLRLVPLRGAEIWDPIYGQCRVWAVQMMN
jgi:hypothetical protein